MVSGTLNNSNFHSFQIVLDIWNFGYIFKVSNFETVLEI